MHGRPHCTSWAYCTCRAVECSAASSLLFRSATYDKASHLVAHELSKGCVHPSVRSSVRPCARASVHMSICMSIRMPICMSANTPTYVPVNMSAHMSIHVYADACTHVPIHRRVCLSGNLACGHLASLCTGACTHARTHTWACMSKHAGLSMPEYKGGRSADLFLRTFRGLPAANTEG